MPLPFLLIFSLPMSRGSLLIAAHIALLLLLLPPSFCLRTSTVQDSALCGNINITYPFQLNGGRQNCSYGYGYSTFDPFELYCEENVTVICLYSGKYYVKAINYSDWTIRVVDAGVQKKDNYFSNPLYSLTSYNLSDDGDPFSSVFYNSDKDIQELRLYSLAIREVPIIFISCANPMHSSRLVDTAPCINNSANSSLSSTLRIFSYVMIGNISSFDLGESCKITQMVVASSSTSVDDLHQYLSCEAIYNEIAHGFELSWFNGACNLCRWDKENCTLDNVSKTKCPSTTKEHWYQMILQVIRDIAEYVFYAYFYVLTHKCYSNVRLQGLPLTCVIPYLGILHSHVCVWLSLCNCINNIQMEKEALVNASQYRRLFAEQ